MKKLEANNIAWQTMMMKRNNAKKKNNNKKEKYSLTFRLGTFTVLEIKVDSKEFRFMALNLGFKINY